MSKLMKIAAAVLVAGGASLALAPQTHADSLSVAFNVGDGGHYYRPAPVRVVHYEPVYYRPAPVRVVYQDVHRHGHGKKWHKHGRGHDRDHARGHRDGYRTAYGYR